MESVPQKTCSKCRQSKPITDYFKCKRLSDGLQSWCKQCDKEYHARRRSDPVIRDRELRLRGERIARIGSLYAQQKAAIDKRYKQRHPEEVRARFNKWRKEGYRNDPVHRQKVQSKAHRRRARAVGVFTAGEWGALCDRYNHRCLCCGEQKPLSPDHVIPISLGGPNTIGNIQPLCHTCNLKKGTKTTDYRF